MNTTTTHIRRLPFDVRPFHRETLNSYSSRLLAANFCDNTHRTAMTRELQTNRGTEAEKAAWRQVLTTRTKRSNLYLDPEPRARLKDGRIECKHFADSLPARFACTSCSAGAVIEQHPHFDGIVCTSHARWLGLWGAPSRQHPTDQATVEAQRQFAKLRRKQLIDFRSYLFVTKALAQALHPQLGIEEAEPLVFATTIALIKALTTDDFARQFLNPAATSATAHSLLTETVTTALGTDCAPVVRDIWIYLRPTVLALRDAIINETLFRPYWPHDYPLRNSVATVLSKFSGQLEPEHVYLATTGDTPVTATTRTAELSLLNYGADVSQPRRYTCDNGHEFDYLPPAVLPNTMTPTMYRPTCGLCTDRRVRSGENDVQTRFPDVATQFDTYRNGGLTAADIAHSSRADYWWICAYGHSHEASPFKKTTGIHQCSVCSTRTVRPGVNCVLTTRPDIGGMWADEWTDGHSPSTMSAGANPLVYLRCPDGHRFIVRLWEITSGKRGCNICVREREIRLEDSLATTHPDICLRWHPMLNGSLTPAHVTYGERRDVWWLCEHGHDYQARLDKITDGLECNICTSRKFSSGNNDLGTKEPILAMEFDAEANGKEAHETFASNHRFQWTCLVNKHRHVQTMPNRRQSRGCPKCPKEDRILNYLHAA